MQPLVNLTTKQVHVILDAGMDINCYYILERMEEEKNYNKDLEEFGPWMSLLYNEGYFSIDSGLTEKAINFLKEVRGSNNSDNLAEKFRDIFPAKKLPTGKYFRSHIRDISERLKKFKKDYPEYSDEEILKAAENYVAYAVKVNYQFIRTSMYFIFKKEGGSDLASWCEMNRNSAEVLKARAEDIATPRNLDGIF